MRTPRLFRLAVILCVGLIAASCGGGESSGGDDTTTSAPPTTTEVTTTTLDVVVTPPTTKPELPPSTVPLPSIPPGANPEDNADIAFAVADLASTLGVGDEDVTVIGWEDVIWPDGALGCPLPGVAYTQALVEGRRIALEANGDVYWYHQGGGRDPFYCAIPAQ